MKKGTAAARLLVDDVNVEGLMAAVTEAAVAWAAAAADKGKTNWVGSVAV